MKIPTNIEAIVTEADIISAINFLIIEGRPTPMCCAGAVCVRRVVSEVAKKERAVNFDIHYTMRHVSIKQEKSATKYWKKSTSANDIDTAYDDAFYLAIDRFGSPANWFPIRKKVEKFMLKKMKPFIGQTFTLTAQITPRKRGEGHSNDIDPQTGKAKGGQVKPIQCHVTRAEKISRMLATRLSRIADVPAVG